MSQRGTKVLDSHCRCSPARKRRDVDTERSRCFRSGPQLPIQAVHTTEVARQARNLHRTCVFAFLGAVLVLPLHAQASLSGARVVADEIITTTTPARNGAGPTWCVGAPLLVRENRTVWASISVTDPEAEPYCNTHWELWRRPEAGGWERVRSGAAASEREPCPLFLPEPDKLMLSIHPKLLERDRSSGGEHTWYCQPAIAGFDPANPADDPKLVQPEFAGRPVFGQHSYRTVGVDSASGSFLLMSIDRQDDFHMTRRDRSGAWHPVAAPEFPIRSCYPNIVLQGGEGHVFAIGDIKEPVEAWRAEKLRVLNRDWDYAFRRVFYAWSPDLASGRFETPLEVDSVDSTAGWAFNLDMAIDARGRVHLLWVRQNIHYDFLRDRFFPDTPIVEEVRHAVLEKGRVASTETLLRREVDGGTSGWGASTGRFHQLPDGRLVAVLSTDVEIAEGHPTRALLLQELDLDAHASPPAVRVALETPLPGNWIFTNTTRGGSQPDNNLDILTTSTRDGVISVRYINVLIP
jgi:hypothetical protein